MKFKSMSYHYDLAKGRLVVNLSLTDHHGRLVQVSLSRRDLQTMLSTIVAACGLQVGRK